MKFPRFLIRPLCYSFNITFQPLLANYVTDFWYCSAKCFVKVNEHVKVSFANVGSSKYMSFLDTSYREKEGSALSPLQESKEWVSS